MPPATITRDRLTALLAAARGKRIAVLGDAMLDVYLRGDVERISPEAPVPVVRVRDRKLALGGAANVAQNAAALGAAPTLVAAIGDDAQGRELADGLRKLGATADGLVKVARPTTTKTRIVARGQQVLRFDEEVDDDLPRTEQEGIAFAIERAVTQADALVIEDYNKGVLTVHVIARAMDAARAKGIPIVVDPKYRSFHAFAGTTVFKPNRRELEAAMGAKFDIEHPEALPSVINDLKVESLLVTLGEQGMALLEKGAQAPHRIPTTAREVYDVVGAGDTVTAYLAAMLAAGATKLEAAIVANYAAGVEVGKSGAATVTAQEVLDAFDHHAQT